MFRTGMRTTLVTALLASLGMSQLSAVDYVWQQQQAEVLQTGEIRWTPQPFTEPDLASGVVRYIDFDNGDDANDGASPSTAWKRHPWDPFSTGNASAHAGVTTYVFKRGVLYRGQLKPDESGVDGDPIVLTSTSTWGSGEAILVGSQPITQTWIQADDPSLTPPARLSGLANIWAVDLTQESWWEEDLKPGFFVKYADKNDDGSPRGQYTGANRNQLLKNVFMGLFIHEDDESVTPARLAADPDFREELSTEFALDYWHSLDGGATMVDGDGDSTIAMQDDDLKGFSADYFEGAFIWKTYPNVMGTPKPFRVEAIYEKKGYSGPQYDSAQGAIAQGSSGGYSAGTRYIIENLPQYLDAEREFFVDETKHVLYYLPPSGVNPNDKQFEFVVNRGMVRIEDQSDIVFSGLGFRYADGVAIELCGNAQRIAITNNTFTHLNDRVITNSFTPDLQLWIDKGKDPADWKLEHQGEILIADNAFTYVRGPSVSLSDGLKTLGPARSWPYGSISKVEVLRNHFYNVGYRHQENVQSAVVALGVGRAQVATIAGNIIERSFGSGIMAQGAKMNGLENSDMPLSRVLLFNNSTQDTALGVNDYGGFSLWQIGPLLLFNNNIGNATGHMPGGYFRKNHDDPINLSYPYYMDGGYKIQGFNNILWDYSNNFPADPYASMTSGYFSVFGFMNHFVNNTLYRHGRAVGGSGGSRTEILGNLFADIKQEFFANNRGGDPSIIGGGGPNPDGVKGVPSLAYAKNLFFGEAIAGSIVKDKIDAADIAEMATQMQNYPVRYGQLGERVESSLIVGETAANGLRDLGSSGADFRLNAGSAAIDRGIQPFFAWPLAANVGEWHFTENHANPASVLDFAMYAGEIHLNRFMYDQVPFYNLTMNTATLSDYIASPSEDWANGALHFDGGRYGMVTDAEMRADVEVIINNFLASGQIDTSDIPYNHVAWTIPDPNDGYDDDGNPVFTDDQVMLYDGSRRNTLISDTRSLLLEAHVRVQSGDKGYLMSKHDGNDGYSLRVLWDGRVQFRISDNGSHAVLNSSAAIDDGQWHHVVAEIDRTLDPAEMRLYLDGGPSHGGSTETKQAGNIVAGASIDCSADFVVGADADLSNKLTGAIDYMRVCHATLAEAETTIEELYEWQYVSGPFLKDMAGNAKAGNKRDIGALEAQEPYAASDLAVTVDGSDYVLSWVDNSAVEDGYRLKRATDRYFTENVETFNVAAGVESYRDSSGMAGVNYFYRVFVLYDSAEAIPSNIVETLPSVLSYGNFDGPKVDGKGNLDPDDISGHANRWLACRNNGSEFAWNQVPGKGVFQNNPNATGTGLMQITDAPRPGTYTLRFEYRLENAGLELAIWGAAVDSTAETHWTNRVKASDLEPVTGPAWSDQQQHLDVQSLAATGDTLWREASYTFDITTQPEYLFLAFNSLVVGDTGSGIRNVSLRGGGIVNANVHLNAQAQITSPQRCLVTWDSIGNSDFYLLRRVHTQVGNEIACALLPIDDTQHRDALQEGRAVADYRYSLQAVRNDTPTVVVAEQLDIVPLDLGLRQTASGGDILVDWNDVESADWYLLDRTTEGSGYEIMVIFLPMDPTEYLDSQVDAMQTYLYNVYAGLAEFLGNG